MPCFPIRVVPYVLAGAFALALLPQPASGVGHATCDCAAGFPLASPDLCYERPGAAIGDYAYIFPYDFLQVVGSSAGGYCCHNFAYIWLDGPGTLACEEFIGCLCANPSPGPEVCGDGLDNDCNPTTSDEPSAPCTLPGGSEGVETCNEGAVVCEPVPMDGQSPETAAISALQILQDGYSTGDGIYWLDPDGAGGNAAFQAYADMTRDGGGWTLGLKTWYQAGHFHDVNAVGSVADALALKGNPYKLSDAAIRGIIGSLENFDVLAEQTGYNPLYTSGNFEYAILRNYTGQWRWDRAMPASSTTTILELHRASDDALAWSGEIQFGMGGAGINGNALLGPNPAGGAGCTINMGSLSHPSWHHFFMSDTNTDSYLYLCNGAQHSSNQPLNHLYWFRAHEGP